MIPLVPDPDIAAVRTGRELHIHTPRLVLVVAVHDRVDQRLVKGSSGIVANS